MINNIITPSAHFWAHSLIPQSGLNNPALLLILLSLSWWLNGVGEKTKRAVFFIVILRNYPSFPIVKFLYWGEVSGSIGELLVRLYEFIGNDEIRQLMKCWHIFYWSCLICWIDHDQKTCSLFHRSCAIVKFCRTQFISIISCVISNF